MWARSGADSGARCDLNEDGTVDLVDLALLMTNYRQTGDRANAKAIAPGYYHTAALLEDGTVRAWGANWSGQCSVPADLAAPK